MNPRVLRRFIMLLFIAGMIVGAGTIFYDTFFDRPPGDYEAERGDMFLSDGDHAQALDLFNQALRASPDHRGALMGRAVVFLETGRRDEAEAELNYLIDFLNRTLIREDLTGRGVLAAAHANRGILRDRDGHYQKALDDYIEALRVDGDAVSGPRLIDKILHDPRPSTVRDRAKYIYNELQKPEAERLLRIPELDAKSRTYKP